MTLSNDLKCKYTFFVNSTDNLRRKASTGAGQLGWVGRWATELGRNECLKKQPSQRINWVWTEGMNEKDEPESYTEKGMFW